MKKIILTLSAVLTAGIVSAQSYPKQPDKTIVNYTSNYKGNNVKKAEVQPQSLTESVEQLTGAESGNNKTTAKNTNVSVNNNTTDNKNKVASNTSKKQK